MDGAFNLNSYGWLQDSTEERGEGSRDLSIVSKGKSDSTIAAEAGLLALRDDLRHSDKIEPILFQ
jgi:hypothetical protein